jgi:hypothetical protein
MSAWDVAFPILVWLTNVYHVTTSSMGGLE